MSMRFTANELEGRKYWLTTPSARENADCGVASPLSSLSVLPGRFALETGKDGAPQDAGDQQ